jgi:hypothetical protein
VRRVKRSGISRPNQKASPRSPSYNPVGKPTIAVSGKSMRAPMPLGSEIHRPLSLLIVPISEPSHVSNSHGGGCSEIHGGYYCGGIDLRAAVYGVDLGDRLVTASGQGTDQMAIRTRKRHAMPKSATGDYFTRRSDRAHAPSTHSWKTTAPRASTSAMQVEGAAAEHDRPAIGEQLAPMGNSRKRPIPLPEHLRACCSNRKDMRCPTGSSMAGAIREQQLPSVRR